MGAQQQARGQVRQLHKDKAAPLVQHMVVGHGLRSLREAQGLSQKDAAQLLGVSKYTMCRNETGETPCKPEFVLKAGQVYQAAPEEVARLLEILDSGNQRRWWQGSEWRGVPKEKLHTLATLEEVAQRIRVYDRDRVPGLLQTEDYARAAIRSGMPGASEEEIEKRVQFRLQRQKHFRESQSAHYLCLLDEVSLTRGFGSKEIMRGQLNHLIQLDGNPRFGLCLVVLSGMNMPIGLGNTILFDFEERLLSTVLYEERDGGGLVFQETDEVEHRVKSFDRLLKASLTKPRSKQRLLDRLKTL